jgi:hypothetical protein
MDNCGTILYHPARLISGESRMARGSAAMSVDGFAI